MTKSSTKKFIPADGWEGLKQNFSKDAMSGFLVFLLAMPLSLGIAKASNYPMIFGLITAIIGGMIVSFIMGSRLSIKGPAAGLIVIASGSVTAFGDGELGWHMALGVSVVAGLLQIVFGLVKAGNLADFFPGAAIHGMLAAIGVIIMAKQLHLLLGINPSELKGKEPLELLAMLPESIMHENAHLTEIGVACLLIMIAMAYVKNEKLKKIPAPLIVLAVSIPLGIALHIKTEGEIANFALVKIGSLSDAFKNGFINVDFSGLTSKPGIFIEYVILYALIGSIESLLTAKAVDGMDPYKRKTDYDKDLIGVGVGNTIAAVVGGLPMISEVARSSANVANGARTRWANFFHGLFLLLAILFATPVIEMIPNVALAAMLVFVGFRLAHPKNFAHTLHIGKEQLLVFVATIIVTLSTDLLMGVGTGIILELIINLLNGAAIKNLFTLNAKETVTETSHTIAIEGAVVFSNLLLLKKKINAVANDKELLLDFTATKLIDHTCVVAILGIEEDRLENEGKISLIGFNNLSSLSSHPASTRLQKAVH